MTERGKRFDELLALMKATHDSKGADYEWNGLPYANLRAVEDWNIDAWQYAMIRADEKMRRLKTFAQGATLNNESAFDSLLDIAVLSIIGYVLLEEKQANKAINKATVDPLKAAASIFAQTARSIHSTDQHHLARWGDNTSSSGHQSRTP